VAKGVTLPYLDQGPEGAPAVVLLHGLGDSMRSFEPVLEHLPRSLRAVAPTLRGHGDADRPATGYLPQDHVSDLAALLDAIGIADSVIAGHSSGSQIAQLFALTHPDRVRGLVLIAAPGPRPDPGLAAPMTAAIAALTDPIDDAWLRGFADTTVGAELPAAFSSVVFEEARKVPARVYQALWPGIRDFDIASSLHRITAPALLVWGDQDRVPVATREAQEALLAALPDARLLVYERTGHSPHWQHPRRFAMDLAAFVEEVFAAG
jgi:non-heme chloroperoxidase